MREHYHLLTHKVCFFNALRSWPTVLCSGFSFRSPAIFSMLSPYFFTRRSKYLTSPAETWREPIPESGRDSVVVPVAVAAIASSSTRRNDQTEVPGRVKGYKVTRKLQNSKQAATEQQIDGQDTCVAFPLKHSRARKKLDTMHALIVKGQEKSSSRELRLEDETHGESLPHLQPPLPLLCFLRSPLPIVCELSGPFVTPTPPPCPSPGAGALPFHPRSFQLPEYFLRHLGRFYRTHLGHLRLHYRARKTRKLPLADVGRLDLHSQDLMVFRHRRAPKDLV